MSGYCTVFGIDSHARTTTVCAVDASTGEVRVRTFRGNPYGEMAEWMAGFPQPSYGVYEAGCTGFVPAREPKWPAPPVLSHSCPHARATTRSSNFLPEKPAVSCWLAAQPSASSVTPIITSKRVVRLAVAAGWAVVPTTVVS